MGACGFCVRKFREVLAGHSRKGTFKLNALIATLILFLTVVFAVSLGILAAYWLVNALLYLLGHRQNTAAPVLVERHASGD